MCFDGSNVIKISKLNDNFKDCSDASDEPLTAIGTYGKFMCGKYFPKSISQWSINDGICDCCDGSDEANNSHVNCPDTCEIEDKAYNHFKKLVIEKLSNNNFTRHSLSKLESEEDDIEWIEEHILDKESRLSAMYEEQIKERKLKLKEEKESARKDYTRSPFNARYKQFFVRWPYEIRSSGVSLGHFQKMKVGKAIFNDGDYCWQTQRGRKTVADLYCGRENRLISVTETEPCVFRAGIVSSYFCDGDSIEAIENSGLEELFEIAKINGFDVNAYMSSKK